MAERQFLCRGICACCRLRLRRVHIIVLLVTIVLAVCVWMRHLDYYRNLWENAKITVQHSELLLPANDKTAAPSISLVVEAGLSGTARTLIPSKAASHIEESTTEGLSTQQALVPAESTTETTVDDIMLERRAKVKEMISHAWKGYYTYAFGYNELHPVSKRGFSPSIFGSTKLGATIVDSLDTLYIAGLMDEYKQGRDWVEQSLHFEQINAKVSVFEFNIRFVGGLLSMYALTGDTVFKTRAVELADRLLMAFQTSNGVPRSVLNLKTGGISGGSVLAEVGSLHLEFQYLTEITGNPVYLQKVTNVRQKVRLVRTDGIYPTIVSSGRQHSHFSLGAMGDSFYEYLLKTWLITSKADYEAKEMFYETLEPIEKKLLHVRQGRLMVNDMRYGGSESKMQHLACFSGGMFALASIHTTDDKATHYMNIGKNITKTCYNSYKNSPTKLGPESFYFSGNGRMYSAAERHYVLRPETVESIFYLWRLTKNPMYREWGWDIVQALEKNCRVENGYSGIKDVYNAHSSKDDVQQSFFIAETLKYLYLLFSDDSIIPLDQWVFNTEAHPLPVLKGVPSV